MDERRDGGAGGAGGDARLARYLDANPALVVVLDRHGRITELNRAGAELLGLEPAAARGLDWFGFVPPEIAPEIRRVFLAILAGAPGSFASHENDVVSARGERRTLLWRNALLLDEAGRPAATLSTGVDITARSELERRLASSEAGFRELFANMSEGFAVHEILLDAAGRPIDYRFLQVNQAFERLTGLAAGQVVGRRARDLLPDLDPALVERYGEVALTGRPITFEHRAEPAGRTFQVSAYRPEPGRFACTFSDVTERKQAEAALEAVLAERDEGERWLRASQRVARLGHYVFDVPGDRWTSSAALDEIFAIDDGYQRTAAGWLGLVHPDDLPAMRAYLGEFLAGGTRFDHVYRVGRAGDPPRWVHGLGDLTRDEAGRPLRLVGTIQDITDRRVAEQAREALAEQLRQAQKLESVGRLAGGVAHDFNNLLVVFLACAEALRQSQEQGRPPNPEDVDELQEAARRAKDLTSQLLAFARKQVVAPVVLDLNAEVHRAERMLQRVLGEDVALALHLEPALWATTFDPGQLQQVLLNLAVNSRDAMPGGGHLTITTSNVEGPEPAEAGWQGAVTTRGPQVRLLVEDDGHGIPPELWPRVFEPFMTTKPVGRGTGLGLATVYGIVQQAGGAIRFRSAPGQGTAFEILLTRAEGPASAVEAARQAPAPATRPGDRILLVEDDELVRAAAGRALRHAGYEVEAAAGGAEVLELLARGTPRPRLLLTDVVMPGMNGRQVAEAARSAWPGLPVLFMSGYAQDIIVHHGVVDPGLDLLEKPFTSEALLERVRAALGG